MALAGGLPVVSFPKFGHPAFAWIALAPLIVAIALETQRPASPGRSRELRTVWLGLIAASRGRPVVVGCVREGAIDCLRLIPRIMLGVIGSGYIAALLPQEVVGRWLGADSGILGLCIAVVGGALTPGGPVIGFSVGAAALKGGAGTPQVIAYTVAWALFGSALRPVLASPRAVRAFNLLMAALLLASLYPVFADV